MNQITAQLLPINRPMALSSIKRGKLEKPLRIILYGVEGCGKSTWASKAPDPIYLAAEDGTATLDVARFPEPKSWHDVLDALDELISGTHEFKTLVIDTLDWLEPLCWAHICEKAGEKNIEAFGYGKGYNAALDEWRVLLSKLERLRDTRNMAIVMLAHSWIRKFQNPEGDDFDRYELKLHQKSAGLLKEWADVVLFARFETFTDKDKKTKRVRGVSSGARIVHTIRTAAYDAKNRYSLPETMPLDWDVFMGSLKARQVASPEKIRAKVKELLEQANDTTLAERVNAAVAAAGDDAEKLARIENKLMATVGIVAEGAGE